MSTLTGLLDTANRARLIRILRYHVIVGDRITSAQINAMVLPIRRRTLDGSEITISRVGNSLKINDATVIRSDVLASNGIIHVIDAVLIPLKINLATSFTTNQSLLFIFVLIAVSFSIHFF